MIKKRVLQYINSQSIKKAQFYRDIGVSNGYLDNTMAISSEILDLICKKYSNLNLIWLVTGSGSMLIDPEAKEKHYEDFVQGKHNIPLSEEAKKVQETNVDYKEKYYATLERLNECLESKDKMRNDYKQTRVDTKQSNTPKLNVKE